jgi:hypothetical protein
MVKNTRLKTGAKIVGNNGAARAYNDERMIQNDER